MKRFLAFASIVLPHFALSLLDSVDWVNYAAFPWLALLGSLGGKGGQAGAGQAPAPQAPQVPPARRKKLGQPQGTGGNLDLQKLLGMLLKNPNRVVPTRGERRSNVQSGGSQDILGLIQRLMSSGIGGGGSGSLFQ